MIRNLLILLVFLGVGFGANVAQSDIFLRQSPKEDSAKGDESPKKKGIFVRQFKKTSEQIERAKKSLGNALNISGVQRQTTDDMRVLAYWKQAGKVPQTLNEFEFYAKALRAQELAAVMAERNKIVPVLEALQAKRIADFRERMRARAPNLDGIKAANALILSGVDLNDLGQPAEAVQAVYTNLRNKAAETVKATAQKPRSFEKNVRKSTPVYRKSVVEEDDSGAAAGGVYKNYR